MLQDFPAHEGPASAGPDPLLKTLRGLWWLVPGALLAYDLFLTIWNLLLRGFLGGELGLAAAWIPWLLHTCLVLGLVAWLWSRRPWPAGVQAGLLAAAALPFLRFGLGRMFGGLGLYRADGLGLLVQTAFGPLLSLGFAVFPIFLRRGQDAEARRSGAAGVMAVAAAAALSCGWVAWALLPLVGGLAGDGFPEEAADPSAPAGAPTPAALSVAGWGGFACALAAWLVPAIGILRFRNAVAFPYLLDLMDGLALLLGSLTWTVLGVRWAKGRREGKALRVLTWMALVLPQLLGVAIGVLLLAFARPRLF
jgi:hypothetical protein